MARDQAKVVVVGAGIIGAAIAFHLAGRGAAVTVVERAKPAGEASGRSFAWINASFDNPKHYYDLRIQSLLEYPQLDRALGGTLGIKWSGALLWDIEGEALTDAVARHRAWGYPVWLLERDEIGAMEPNLKDPPPHAAYAPYEASLEPVAATEALLAGAADLGVTISNDCAVETLITRNNRAVGVETAQGAIEADTVVLAAGVATEVLVKTAGAALPMNSSPGLLIHTKPVAPLVQRMLLTPDLHMKQDPDGRIVAAEDFGGGTGEQDPDATAASLMADLARLLSGGADLELERVTVGWRPIPKDGFPAVGPTPEIDGLYVAVMHSGVTLAPIVGRLAAEEILTGMRTDLLAPFRPSRFVT